MSVDSGNLAYIYALGAISLWPVITGSSRITVGYRYTRRGSSQTSGTVGATYWGGGDPLNADWWIHHNGSAIIFGYGDSSAQTYATYSFTETPGVHTVVCMFDYANDTRAMFYDGRDVTAQLSDTNSWTRAPVGTSGNHNLFGGRSLAGTFYFLDFPVEDVWFAETALGIGAARQFHVGASPFNFCQPSRYFPCRDLIGWEETTSQVATYGDRTNLRLHKNLRPLPNASIISRFTAAAGGGLAANPLFGGGTAALPLGGYVA